MSAKECFSWVKANRLRSFALTIAVGAVLAPLGCSCDGDGTSKNSGTDEIDFSPVTSTDNDPFDYSNALLQFLPAGALISSVTNISTDTAGKGVKLAPIRHTDANSVMKSVPATTSCTTGELDSGDSTSVFDNQTVEGAWTVRAICTSAALLDPSPPSPAVPARIALKIAWHK